MRSKNSLYVQLLPPQTTAFLWGKNLWAFFKESARIIGKPQNVLN
jgi:hypothetical protein